MRLKSASQGWVGGDSRVVLVILAWMVGNLTTGWVIAGPDPVKVMGPAACGECHVSEFEAWQSSHHFRGFTRMHREPQAKELAEKLGIRRIKNDPACASCHYIAQLKEGQPEPVAAIACESCHGPGRDWIKLHCDFGPDGAKRETESPEHAAERRTRSAAAGLIRPSTTYSLGAACFSCHTVPREDVVNAGHSTGGEFDLLAWSQGEVRHNFNGNQRQNREPRMEHKRTLFVLGRVLEVDYSLRAASLVTKEGPYATASFQRVKSSLQRLQEIQEVTGLPELKVIADAGAAVDLKPNNSAALVATADQIAEVARAFGVALEGKNLSALDGLMPAPEKYKGPAYQP